MSCCKKDEVVRLEFKMLSETAKEPQKNHEDDAAYDLFCDLPTEPMVLKPNETKIVPTNVAIMPPRGYYTDIRGRSGMNSKGKLVILGLVDSFYTGQYGVVLHNSTEETITVNHHDKIAQFTVNKKYESELVKVEKFSAPENARGVKGFGASGSK